MDKIQIKKLLQILMASLVWDINFRLTFKNIDLHMDLGSYPSLIYDPIIILIKNISCGVIFLLVYFISKKLNTPRKKAKKLLKGDIQRGDSVFKYNGILGNLAIYHDLDTKAKQFFFCIKIFLLILVIYICEEIHLTLGNTHILDRLNVPMRNLAVLIIIFIFSPLLIKKQFKLYKHQLIPSIIVVASSIAIILFNFLTVPRFEKIFDINFLYYMIIYVLMGIEILLIKYLTDIQVIKPLIILVLKGFIGTMTFIIINIICKSNTFFNFIDGLMIFEYDNMHDEFIIYQKIFYIITTLIVQYLKIFIIKKYSESHFLSVAMIADIFFFPLYYIEKFAIQDFSITTSSSFYVNLIFGIINPILLLIFNEIIELKFCGIEKNLNKNIDKRRKYEMNHTMDIDDEDDLDIDLDNI